MKGQIKKVNLKEFKYDEVKFKTDPEYKNSILYTLALIKSC